jgi:integrase
MTDSSDKKKKPKPRRVGQVLARGPNKWLIRIFRGYKPNGGNDYFNKTFHGTKTDAEKWRAAAQARKDRGEPLEDPDITFEALYDEWMASEKRAPKTVEIYRDNFKYYIGPAWASARISSIMSRDVQKWVNSMAGKYASATVRIAYGPFRSAIRYALDHEMLLKSPLRGIKLPKKEKRKANVLEPAEALKVLDVCRTERGGIFAAFLLWAGTRPNEAGGLQWKDVNWEKGSVEIRRDVVWLHGAKWVFDDVKTENGKRSFTLPASFMAWLKEHRQAQLKQKMRLGRDWYDYDLVFCDEVGAPLTPSAYRFLWKKILKQAGLPEDRQKMRAYDARHTMATLLLLERTPTKVVSARLGHASTAITEDVYSHVLESMQAEATDDLERAILRGKKA